MRIEFKRADLYEEVWSTPMTQLGKRYGLSDNGIRKICKAMNIPLPKTGHWAKVAAGKGVSKTPLPAECDRDTYICHPVEVEASQEAAGDKSWMQGMVDFDRQPENAIAVDKKPGRWHPVVVPFRKRLSEAAAKAEQDRKVAERFAEREKAGKARGWQAPAGVHHWRNFAYYGQILCQTHHSMPLRVSPLAYERALVILNALLREAEIRGFTADYSKGRGRFVLLGHGSEVSIRISEKLLEEPMPKGKGENTSSWPSRSLAPTGKLRLYVGQSGYSEAEISDQEDAPLEARLGEAFTKVYRAVVRVREHDRKWRAWNRAREEEAQRHAEQARLRQEEERRREMERERVAQLIKEASDWQMANLIRRYVVHATANADGVFSSNRTEEWKEWALHVAASLDSTGAENF